MKREKGRTFVTEPECFARYCVTFSHGDFPDETPARTGGRTPYRGEGLFCLSPLDTFAGLETHSVLRLPKRHASISRRAESGALSRWRSTAPRTVKTGAASVSASNPNP